MTCINNDTAACFSVLVFLSSCFCSDFEFTCDEEICYYEVRVFDGDENLEVISTRIAETNRPLFLPSFCVGKHPRVSRVDPTLYSNTRTKHKRGLRKNDPSPPTSAYTYTLHKTFARLSYTRTCAYNLVVISLCSLFLLSLMCLHTC